MNSQSITDSTSINIISRRKGSKKRSSVLPYVKETSADFEADDIEEDLKNHPLTRDISKDQGIQCDFDIFNETIMNTT